MDPTPLLAAGMIFAVTTWTRWPISRDLRPRVLFELVLIAAAGVGGAVVGGSTGSLLALVGLLPSMAVMAARRRVNRFVIDERPAQLRRAVAMLDVLSWPVPDQPFNVASHLLLAELEGDPTAFEEFLRQDRRRPTTSVKLALAFCGGDRAEAGRLATLLLREPHGAEEQFDGFRAMLRVDLPAALEWYRSPAAARMRRRGSVSVDLQVLMASGRLDSTMLLLNRLPLGEFERDVARARALLGRGDMTEAHQLLLRHGERGQALIDRFVRCGDGPQPLGPTDLATVDQVAARAAGQAATLGRDTGRWRPVLTWVLGAGLVLSLIRQLQDGGFTTAALYDQGAFVTGPLREWSRSLPAPYLHANVAHLLYNLLGLLAIGRLVESRITRWQYVLVWLLTSSGSFVLLGVTTSHTGLAVGASGGVLGLLGAGLAVIGVQLKRHRTESLRSAFRFLLVLVAFQLVADHLVPNVAWIGHLSGLAIGSALGVAYAVQQPRTAAIDDSEAPVSN